MTENQQVSTVTFESTLPTMIVSPSRLEKGIPDAYRLVTKPDERGGTIYLLQGYFTWTQGLNYGGEWRDLETQEWLFAEDDIPFGTLQ